MPGSDIRIGINSLPLWNEGAAVWMESKKQLRSINIKSSCITRIWKQQKFEKEYPKPAISLIHDKDLIIFHYDGIQTASSWTHKDLCVQKMNNLKITLKNLGWNPSDSMQVSHISFTMRVYTWDIPEQWHNQHAPPMF